MIRHLTACFCLAACGGGSGGNDNPMPDFAALEAGIVGGDITPAAQLPESGAFTYAGLARLDLPLGDAPSADFVGNLDLTLAFDSGVPPVLGAISNLQGNGTTLSGILTVSDGMLQPDIDTADDYQFNATVQGTLYDQGTDYTLSGEMAGDIYGRTGDAIAGVIFGDIANGDVIDVFDGAFAAQTAP